MYASPIFVLHPQHFLTAVLWRFVSHGLVWLGCVHGGAPPNLFSPRLHGVDDLRVEPHPADPLGPNDVRVRVRSFMRTSFWRRGVSHRLPQSTRPLE